MAIPPDTRPVQMNRRQTVRLILRNFLFALAVGAWFGPPLHAQVVLNELMYHPVEEPAFTETGVPVLDLNHDVHEYVELFNAGGNTVDLSRWRLDGGIQFTIPDGVTLTGGSYLVIAKDPPRLAGLPQYGLVAAQLHGPYAGQLSNGGELVQLKNAADQLVDALSYQDSFPWPGSADALGASQRWTGIDPLLHQYRGRSLERVSPFHPGQDPANWRASALPGEPTPGRANSFRRNVPFPVVVERSLQQGSDGRFIIRSNEPALLQITFSATNELGPVRVDYFVDELDGSSGSVNQLAMSGTPPRFSALIPGFAAGSVVRYQVWAERRPTGAPAYLERVLPREDDPDAWKAYYVTPVRESTNAVIYDLLVSSNSLFRLNTHMRDNPLNGYSPPVGTPVGGQWNETEPAVLAYNGVVYDVQVRYSGSFWRRTPGARRFKVNLPRYQRLEGRSTLLITDKDAVNAFCYLLYAEAGLPAAKTRWVSLAFNYANPSTRLEFEEHDQGLLDRYDQEQRLIDPSSPAETSGHIFKSSGIGDDRGPYGPADGRALGTDQGWPPLSRYEWSYSSKNRDWQGFLPLQLLCEGLAAARGPGPSVDVPTLRTWLAANWDVDAMLTYLAIRNWTVAVDDTYHNYFIWQKADGRWTLLGWDFDNEMNIGNTNQTIFIGEGGNAFKDSFYKAFREEYKQRLYWLNNTLLDPDYLSAFPIIPPQLATFGPGRQRSINQQLGFGPFHKPGQPEALSPAGSESVFPPARLQAGAYTHSLDPAAPAHAASVWQIRDAEGNYRFPLYAATSTVDLASTPIPFALLESGQIYFWRCIYLDATGHPSAPAVESAFRYGGSFQRIPLLGLEASELWKHESSGTNLGTGWRDPDYDDSNWIEGPPLLGVSAATLAAPIRTPLPLGHSTYYFRKRFNFPGNPASAVLRLRPLIDDGAVFFLNGAEFLRLNLTTFFRPGTLPYGTLATQEIGDPAYGLPIVIAVTNLVAGENLLAVEVHQRNVNSEDVIFGLSLEATIELESGGVRLNELMAFNQSALPHGTAYPDWIELHNPTDRTQLVSGLSLTDDPLDPLKFVFPPGISLSRGGFMHIWCDDRLGEPGLHTGFNLRAEGESVWLFRPSQNGLSQVDQLTFGLQLADRSLGRVPDGTGAWQLTRSTPSQPNQALPLGSERNVKINEWMASPASGADWFELFNPELLPVDIGGLYLTDNLDNRFKSPIPPLSFLDRWSFSQFCADNNPGAGANHVGFALNGSGEAIALSDAADTLIDAVTFGAQSQGISQGRLADGSANVLFLLSGATPGRSNAGDADADGLPDAWEQTYQLNPLLRDDGAWDSDGDGPSNFEEFLAGTNPRDPNDFLRLEGIQWMEGQPAVVALRFQLRPGKVYQLQYANLGMTGPWHSLQTIGPEEAARMVEVIDGNLGILGSRFYRLVLRRG